MKKAVTRQANAPQIAICPECGAEREYRVEGGVPVPTESNAYEIREGHELASGTLTSYENPVPTGVKRTDHVGSVLTDSRASWTPDEFKGALVSLFVDGYETERFRVMSNTETTMTLVFGARVNGPRTPEIRDKELVHRSSGYTSMPDYRVFSFHAPVHERMMEKLWKKHIFICGKCGTLYTVD